MEAEQNDEFLITINFDNGDNVRLSKSYLMEHSLYFEAMFSGNFKESQCGKIQLKDINYRGFMSVIECLKHNNIIYDSVEELLLVLETSQLFQFKDINQKSIQVIKEKYLFTTQAIPIFSLSYRLELKELYEKARVYILYNFKTFLVHNRDSFFELTEEDLQLLLNDNGLFVDSETDVYDLVIDWCSETNNINMEYKMAISCVHFNSMNNYQLQHCLLKTNNLNLQNTIKQYLNYTNENRNTVELLIRPIRSVPNVLCAIKNEKYDYAFIYRWDWTSLKFSKFIKLDPLPLGTKGYHVFIKGMDIFVLGGKIGHGNNMWNETGWKYNLLTEQWTKLEGLILSKRRHGVGYFCGNELFLIGGHTIHKLPNEFIEKFKIDKDKDTLVPVQNYICDSIQKKVDRKKYYCLEYKQKLVMITKDNNPKWYELCPVELKSAFYKWEKYSMNLNAIIICAVTFQDNVYLLTYDDDYIIVLYNYCAVNRLCQKLRCFKSVYIEGCTMCTFNIDKAMVFGNNVLEYYSLDNNVYNECVTQLDSFHSNYCFSLPIY